MKNVFSFSIGLRQIWAVTFLVVISALALGARARIVIELALWAEVVVPENLEFSSA